MSGKKQNNLPSDKLWVRILCAVLGIAMVFGIVLMLIQSIASSASVDTGNLPANEQPTVESPISVDTVISVGLCYGASAVQSYTLASAGGFVLRDARGNTLFEPDNSSLVICPDSILSFVGDEIKASHDGVSVCEEYHIQISAYAFNTDPTGSDIDNPALINPGTSITRPSDEINKGNLSTKLQLLLDSQLLTSYTNSIYPAYSGGSYTIRLGQFESREEADEVLSRLRKVLDMKAEVVASDDAGFTVIDGKDHSVICEITNSDRKIELYAKNGVFSDMDAKTHDGFFTFTRKQISSATLNVINTFALEDYISEILPVELSEDCPESAAQAMAIVLRTNAYRMLGRHKSDGFDVCTDPHCHTYGGNLTASPRLSECVKKTAGQIIFYDGKPIHAVYSMETGTAIVSAEEALGHTGYPYLVSKKTDWELVEGWTVVLYPKDISRMLVNSGYDSITSDISTLMILEKSISSDYVTKMSLTDRFGNTIELSGSETIRNLFGGYLPSAKFVLSVSDGTTEVPFGSFIFTGNCTGSGIGLSIGGAKAMAKRGSSFEEILKTYYEGITVSEKS